MANPIPSQSWYDRLPKVELHLHLEGAIPLPVLWQLVQKYGGDPLLPDQAALQRKFEYKDFPHFIDTWIWKNQFLREYRLLEERLGFSRPELRTLLLNAVSASWLPPARKSKLSASFRLDPAWQED